MGAEIEDTTKFLLFIFKHYADKYNQLNWPNLYEYKLKSSLWFDEQYYIENFEEKVKEDVKIFLSRRDKSMYIQHYVEFLRNNLQATQMELDHYEHQIT